LPWSFTSSSDIAVIVIHALSHHPHAQPETQNEVFQGCDAVDLLL